MSSAHLFLMINKSLSDANLEPIHLKKKQPEDGAEKEDLEKSSIITHGEFPQSMSDIQTSSPI